MSATAKQAGVLFKKDRCRSAGAACDGLQIIGREPAATCCLQGNQSNNKADLTWSQSRTRGVEQRFGCCNIDSFECNLAVASCGCCCCCQLVASVCERPGEIVNGTRAIANSTCCCRVCNQRRYRSRDVRLEKWGETPRICTDRKPQRRCRYHIGGPQHQVLLIKVRSQYL